MIVQPGKPKLIYTFIYTSKHIYVTEVSLHYQSVYKYLPTVAILLTLCILWNSKKQARQIKISQSIHKYCNSRSCVIHEIFSESISFPAKWDEERHSFCSKQTLQNCLSQSIHPKVAFLSLLQLLHFGHPCSVDFRQSRIWLHFKLFSMSNKLLQSTFRSHSGQLNVILGSPDSPKIHQKYNNTTLCWQTILIKGLSKSWNIQLLLLQFHLRN